MIFVAAYVEFKSPTASLITNSIISQHFTSYRGYKTRMVTLTPRFAMFIEPLVDIIYQDTQITITTLSTTH